jgi:hypothetical protein
MKQATRISIPPPDPHALRNPQPSGVPGRTGWRGWSKHLAFPSGSTIRDPRPIDAPDGSLLGRLRDSVRRIVTAANARFGTARLRSVNRSAAVPPPADPRAIPEPESDAEPGGFDFLGWLKHLAFYLGAVATICLIGLYFLWQIPFVRDPSQILRIADDGRPTRPFTAMVTPATPASPAQVTPSPPPVNNTPVSEQSLAPTEVVVATAVPPAATAEPSDASLPADSQPAVPSDSPAEPVPPTTEPTVEVVPPPTPQAEIEQLLAEAQQQMENRRLTAPASGNALTTYRRVLELQPNHPVALDGIQRITSYYRDMAQQSLQQGKLDESLAYTQRGLRAEPKSDALLNLRRQAQLAKQREREEAQRQAMLEEEMQRQRLEQIRQEQLRRQQEQQPWWRQSPSYDNSSSGFNQR